MTILLAPLQTCGEELLFRGVLMQALGSWFKKPIVAIILQSLIFVTVHPYNFIGMVDIFVYGLFYGLVTWKTKGLEASMAMHTANNTFFICFTWSRFIFLWKKYDYGNFLVKCNIYGNNYCNRFNIEQEI